jgi:hypothetical protein
MADFATEYTEATATNNGHMSENNLGHTYAATLDAVYDFLGRFVAYPSEAAQIAHTLWIAHTHLMGSWESTPRIAFLSPEPGSGKTRALEVTELLVPRAVEAVNVTPAYLFRKVGDQENMPTILHDEIDTVFGPKAKENEEIRGFLNAGHRRGAVAGRCVVRGKIVETEEIPAYCPVAMAGLGGLPDTLLSRSVIIRMRRRAPNETVQPYRRKEQCREGWQLQDQLEKWGAKISVPASKHWPNMPDGIADRDADVWEPLLTVADLAGGEWPKRARVTAVTLVTDSKAATPSLGIRLLDDIRTVFGDRDAMGSEELLKALRDLEESPWGDLKGKPLDARGLANRLRQYEIRRTDVRIGDWHGKGYKREDLWDAWRRYLPRAEQEINTETEVKEVRDPADLGPPGYESVTSVTSGTNLLEAEIAEAMAANDWNRVAQLEPLLDEPRDG